MSLSLQQTRPNRRLSVGTEEFGTHHPSSLIKSDRCAATSEARGCVVTIRNLTAKTMDARLIPRLTVRATPQPHCQLMPTPQEHPSHFWPGETILCTFNII